MQMCLIKQRKNFAFNIYNQNAVLLLVLLQSEVSVSFWHLQARLRNATNILSQNRLYAGRDNEVTWK
jgi:hypothetical protein